MKIKGKTKCQRPEIMEFVKKFEKITKDYKKHVNPDVSAIVIHPDFMARMNQLKNFI